MRNKVEPPIDPVCKAKYQIGNKVTLSSAAGWQIGCKVILKIILKANGDYIYAFEGNDKHFYNESMLSDWKGGFIV